MINDFLIYAHPIIPALPANTKFNTEFQVTDRRFAVESRVSNAANQAGIGALFCTLTLGSIGASPYAMQNQASDSALWLPQFGSSEKLPVMSLDNVEKITFTYENRTPFSIPNLQSCFIGHKLPFPKVEYDSRYPYSFYTDPIVVPAAVGGAPGRTQTVLVISADFAFLCRAFVSNGGNSILINIRDRATGYTYTNLDVLASLFTYNFEFVNNFKPQPFSPFILPQRTQLELTFSNLTAERFEIQFGMIGELVTY